MKKQITILALAIITCVVTAAPLTGTLWKSKSAETQIRVKAEPFNGRVKIDVYGSDTNTEALIVWAARAKSITTEQLTNHFTILTNTP